MATHFDLDRSRTAHQQDGAAWRLDAAAFHAARRFADLSFGRIAYVERGEGPAALFFHGYPLNGFQWRGALERLSAHRRCIAPDLMGLGYSEVAGTQDLAPGTQAAMACALLDALGEAAADIVGNDSGGTIAQLFAAHYPERTRSLLLTNCEVHENAPPAEFLPVIKAAGLGVLADRFLRRALEDKAYARSTASLGGFYTDPSNLTDECIEFYMRPLVSSPQRVAQFHAYTTAFLPNPLTAIEPELRRLAAPARMVWATHAPGFGVDWAHWLDRVLPGSRGVRLVEGANLFFPEEMPDLLAEEALALWAKTS